MLCRQKTSIAIFNYFKIHLIKYNRTKEELGRHHDDHEADCITMIQPLGVSRFFTAFPL